MANEQSSQLKHASLQRCCLWPLRMEAKQCLKRTFENIYGFLSGRPNGLNGFFCYKISTLETKASGNAKGNLGLDCIPKRAHINTVPNANFQGQSNLLNDFINVDF
jgi:hypothetical protein